VDSSLQTPTQIGQLGKIAARSQPKDNLVFVAHIEFVP